MNVSFEPGCRDNWHVHHGENGGGDQILLCTAGSGWYQAEGRHRLQDASCAVVVRDGSRSIESLP
ncbi:hypothetical protein [Brachybacterium hainanense]|uniref:Cupin domain-containing protein n=1 Tax=Brachybacterium hainanense TaxID=1541174 RepID=A0ABV6RBF6_9MICO